MKSDEALAIRVLLGFALGFVIGFERGVRGSPAGDRTFALIGLGTAAVTAVTTRISPQAIAGAITGIGFIGGGLLFRSEGGVVKGLTSATSIFVTAAIGIVVGTGHLLLGAIVAAAVLFTLELRYMPGLRLLDARRYAEHVSDDAAPPFRREARP